MNKVTVVEVEPRLKAWWRANRWTLVIALWVVAVLAVWIHAERETKRQAEFNLYLMAHQTSDALRCYDFDRSTSVIIAGGSRRAVNDALLDAAAAAGTARLSWVLAEERRKGGL